MQSFTAVVEKDKDTGLYVGFVPGFHGAHSQGSTLDELQQNLREVLTMLLEDDQNQPETRKRSPSRHVVPVVPSW